MTPPSPTRFHQRCAHSRQPRRQLLASWLLAAALGAQGCRSPHPSEDQRLPVAEPRALIAVSNPPTAAKAAAAPRALTEVAGTPLAISKADTQVLQTLLMARIEQSKLELRDYLLHAAQGEVASQASSVTIGRWALRDYDGKLSLYHRGPASAVFHVAEVAGGTGTWSVQEPVRGEILARPRP